PNRDGATTWTRPDGAGAGPVGFMVGSTGTARTAEGRGDTLLGVDRGCSLGWADSRGMVRTLLMPPLNASAGSWSWSWDRGSTRVAAENPRGARSSRSSYSSYSSSSRPRYTMVFFMNEGDIPSPVIGQRSACSATQAGPGGPGPRLPPPSRRGHRWT